MESKRIETGLFDKKDFEEVLRQFNYDMSKKVIYHRHSDKVITRRERITKCPMGKNRKMKPTDSPYNDVCDGCVDNVGGHMNSAEEIIYCDYRKRFKKN